MKNPTPFQTFILTILALVAFAANSVLCRMAMGQAQIDGASFTTIRLLSGALTMLVIFRYLNIQSSTLNFTFISKTPNLKPSISVWLAPLMLFGYAWCFSFAYLQLNTATGALILFATVQLTMLGYSLVKGNRPNLLSWLGIFMAIAGFVYLMLPSATQPDIVGFLWMLIAGLCWAVYTIAGKSSNNKNNAIQATGENFIRSVPLTIIVMIALLVIFGLDSTHLTIEGALLAILSGCFASACGYTLWYLALNKLTITQAAVSQLSVPVIAAFGGIIWMAEPITLAFMISAGFILVGIMLTYIKTY